MIVCLVVAAVFLVAVERAAVRAGSGVFGL
jgi:hypothetical protein